MIRTLLAGVFAFALASPAAAGIVIQGSAPHSVLLAEGSSPAATAGPGTQGQVLTGNGPTADPTFQTLILPTPTPGHCTEWTSATEIQDAGAACGIGSVTSVGLSLPATFACTGSPVVGAGTISCGWANESANVVLAGPATGSAAAPTFRALVGADLPNPGASSHGGVNSLASTAHQFFIGLSTAGNFSRAQPACADVSDASAFCNGTSAANLTGTLPAAALPNPSASTLGGVESLAVVSHDFLTGISTAGLPTQAQPAFTDISGLLAAAQLPNPSATTLGGTQSLAAVSHKWINTISTAGVPAATQPAASDLSDTVARTTFTPTVDFATPGDRTISYATQTGAYTRVGGQTCFWESLTFTPTYTTAAGNLLISFPPSGGPTDANVWAFPISNLSSPTWPSTATLATIEATGGSFIIRGMKSAAGANPFTVSNVPTGVAMTVVFGGCFF